MAVAVQDVAAQLQSTQPKPRDVLKAAVDRAIENGAEPITGIPASVSINAQAFKRMVQQAALILEKDESRFPLICCQIRASGGKLWLEVASSWRYLRQYEIIDPAADWCACVRVSDKLPGQSGLVQIAERISGRKCDDSMVINLQFDRDALVVTYEPGYRSWGLKAEPFQERIPHQVCSFPNLDMVTPDESKYTTDVTVCAADLVRISAACAALTDPESIVNTLFTFEGTKVTAQPLNACPGLETDGISANLTGQSQLHPIGEPISVAFQHRFIVDAGKLAADMPGSLIRIRMATPTSPVMFNAGCDYLVMPVHTTR